MAVAGLLSAAFFDDAAMAYIFPEPDVRRVRLPRLFAILFDVPFPPVNRRHGWKDIDACRQPLVDERAGEGGAVGVGCDSRQDEDDLWC